MNKFIPNFGIKGWRIAILGICFYFMFMSVFDVGLNTILGVYNELYGWSTTQVSFFVSMGGWCSIIGIAIFGTICKKKGVKFVSIIGLLGVAISFVIVGYATTILPFAIGVICYFVFATAFGVIGVGQFGANWFPKTKGMYMGIVTMGITLGSATINLIMHAIIGTKGITFFMLSFAVVSIVLAVIVALFTKNYPEEAGAYPDNDKTMTREKLDEMVRKNEEYRKNSPWTTRKILVTPTTWKLAIGWSLPMMAAVGIMSQLTLALMSYGHEFMFGIILLTSLWPMGVLGNYLGGVVDEKYGTKKASYFVIIIEIIGAAIMILFGSNATMAAIGVAIFMFAISACTNISMSMTTTVFGRNDFENAWPTVSVISKLITSSGLVIIALIAEMSSYNVAFIAMIGIFLVALLIMISTTGECITNTEKSSINV